MGSLIDKIQGFEHYEKKFATWEATEQIIDDTKAFWCLKKPDSNYEKVCLYRDGCNMFVYGDYGQFTFDSMTWSGSVHNLEYDNIGYQFEKLNYESMKSLEIFDENKCEDDIYEWLRYEIENGYNYKDNEINEIINQFKNLHSTRFYVDEYDIEEFCEEHNIEDLSYILKFVGECLSHIDEYEWIAFLRNSNLEDFDEVCESSLWNAGKVVHQRYYICLYALQVCGEKLKNIKEN